MGWDGISFLNFHKVGILKQPKVVLSQFWRPGGQCQQGWCLLEALRENSFHAYLLASGECQEYLEFLSLEAHTSNLCICIHIAFFPLCTSICKPPSLI